jgi:hypothetical protein
MFSVDTSGVKLMFSKELTWVWLPGAGLTDMIILLGEVIYWVFC